MGWNPFAPKHPSSDDTTTQAAKARRADEARRANARIYAALADMEKMSVEIGRRRAELRAMCPLGNHDRCRSH